MTRDPHQLVLRETGERRRQLRGLLLLAVAAIPFILIRYGFRLTFTPGWWRLW